MNLAAFFDTAIGISKALTAAHPELKDSGFAHVSNVGRLADGQVHELAPGIELRRAKPSEAMSIKMILEATPTLGRMSRNPYETTVHSKSIGPATTSYSETKLPESEWRYHVLTFRTQPKVYEFVESTVVSRRRLFLGPQIFAFSEAFTGVTFMEGDATLKTIIGELQFEDALHHITKEDIEDIRVAHEKVSAIRPKPSPGPDPEQPILNAMRKFSALDSLHKAFPLRFLGYVSILESLITHQPKPTDPYDSLTRQVRKKMSLISNRSHIRIPYELFNEPDDREKVWKSLYSYRSAIAHGASPKFDSDSELKPLKNAETAVEFIMVATAAVMRQFLEEPQLMADLHDC